MRVLTIATLLFAAATAHAEGERATTVSLGLVFGVHSLPDSAGTGNEPVPSVARVAEAFAGPRLVLAFEPAPLEQPAVRGYRTDVQLVPELIGGAFVDDSPGQVVAQMMIGAGLRGELRIAQREMGLLRVSARLVAYVAARGFVVGEARDPMGELVIGEYILFGRSGRFGFEVGGMRREQAGLAEAQDGVLGQLYLGGAL